ncbi:MAG: polysulfide reductase, partial [Nocardioidaceae bacterium]|nr:polysulfide reductase [Nocardioidaceae bacterium]
LVPTAQSGPAVRLAGAGAVLELGATETMTHRLGMVAEPYQQGRSGRLMKVARGLTLAGLGLSVLGPRSRWGRAAAGAAYVAGSVVTRFGVFEAGLASARDPKYTVEPQRARLNERRRIG